MLHRPQAHCNISQLIGSGFFSERDLKGIDGNLIKALCALGKSAIFKAVRAMRAAISPSKPKGRASHGAIAPTRCWLTNWPMLPAGAFQADLFDEYLCYKTSDLRYRRLLGPYFSSFAAMPMVCMFAMSCLLLSSSLFFFPNSVFEELAWKFWLFALTLQISIFFCYLSLFGLFTLATFRLKRAFGDRGSWWLFRLTQKEALKVAFLGAKYLKGFNRRADSLPRDQLLSDQLTASSCEGFSAKAR